LAAVHGYASSNVAISSRNSSASSARAAGSSCPRERVDLLGQLGERGGGVVHCRMTLIGYGDVSTPTADLQRGKSSTMLHQQRPMVPSSQTTDSTSASSTIAIE
jgi:hypothetical protein